MKKWSEVAQSCLTLCDPMDCSLPGSSIHGIFQTRVLEWVAISFSRGSSQPRDRTVVSCIAGRLFTIWATREATKLENTMPNGRNQTQRPLIIWLHLYEISKLPRWPSNKESASNVRDVGDGGLIPESGRPPGEGNGNPLQYSYLPGESHGQRSLAGYSL